MIIKEWLMSNYRGCPDKYRRVDWLVDGGLIAVILACAAVFFFRGFIGWH